MSVREDENGGFRRYKPGHAANDEVIMRAGEQRKVVEEPGLDEGSSDDSRSEASGDGTKQVPQVDEGKTLVDTCCRDHVLADVDILERPFPWLLFVFGVNIAILLDVRHGWVCLMEVEAEKRAGES